MQRIGIQGELGSYSEEAAHLISEGAFEPVPFRDNRDVTRALATGDIDQALLPIENSLVGSVIASYDAILAEPGIFAIGHTVLPIHHCLLGVAGAALEDVQVVESHPVALGQCQAFLADHPRMQARASADTAGSAREIAQAKDPRRAAIASARAADRYGLDILARNIEDRDDTTTRFLLLSRTPTPVHSDTLARTMLVYSTRNIPGALVRTLAPLADRGMNMVKLESRPAGEPWSYRFIVELEHRGGLEEARAAIDAIAPFTLELRQVGTW